MARPPRSGPQVGIVGRFDAAPESWSGIPFGLSNGLRELGVTTVAVSAEPPGWMVRGFHRWLSRRGRIDAWHQSHELIATRDLLVRARRARLRTGRVDGWVQMGSEFGHPLGKGFVTFEDMTVASARRLPDFLGGPLPPALADAWQRRQAAMYARARACCTASRWQAASLIEDYGVPREKIHIVGLGWNVDVDVEVDDRDWSTPRFLFVGLGWHRKNGAAVVEAFRRLRQECPTATLDLVGDHPMIDEPGVTNHGVLRFSDPERRPALEALFARATCLVVPSLYEPFGIVYAEAAHAGIPTIASAVGGGADAIGPGGGILVDPTEPPELLGAMRTLVDPGKARAMGASAQAHASQLSWRLVAGRVATVLGIQIESGPVADLVAVP